LSAGSNEIDLFGFRSVNVTAWLSGVNSDRAQVSVRVARFMVKGEYLCTFYAYTPEYVNLGWHA